jgi:hypothetical protein
MTFHLAAYYKVVGTNAVVELTPVTDAVIAQNAAGRFVLSSDGRIVAAYAGGPSLQRARVSTPWKVPSNLRPINTTSTPVPAGTNVPPIARWLELPIVVPAQQDLVFDVYQNSGVNQNAVGLVWLTAEGLDRRPEGETLTIRGDVSGAAPTVYQWSEVTVVWEYALPPGLYGIVGSECISSFGIGHRWIVDTTNYRPGGISAPGLTNYPHPYQMNGELGLWARFSAPVMPRLEVFCSTADATHTVYLQLVRL